MIWTITSENKSKKTVLAQLCHLGQGSGFSFLRKCVVGLHPDLLIVAFKIVAFGACSWMLTLKTHNYQASSIASQAEFVVFGRPTREVGCLFSFCDWKGEGIALACRSLWYNFYFAFQKMVSLVKKKFCSLLARVQLTSGALRALWGLENKLSPIFIAHNRDISWCQTSDENIHRRMSTVGIGPLLLISRFIAS